MRYSLMLTWQVEIKFIYLHSRMAIAIEHIKLRVMV